MPLQIMLSWPCSTVGIGYIKHSEAILRNLLQAFVFWYVIHMCSVEGIIHMFECSRMYVFYMNLWNYTFLPLVVFIGNAVLYALHDNFCHANVRHMAICHHMKWRHTWTYRTLLYPTFFFIALIIFPYSKMYILQIWRRNNICELSL